MTPPAWYALTVKPHHERVSSRHLHEKGFEEFSPLYRALRRWSDRQKQLELCLFPGYVFCRFGWEERCEVLRTPGITSIVSFGKIQAPIPDAEIDAVRAMVSSGFPIEPWPYLRPGEPVIIERGSLAGVRGTLCRQKDRFRVIVTIELLQRSIAVEIDREAIAKVKHPPFPPKQDFARTA